MLKTSRLAKNFVINKKIRTLYYSNENCEKKNEEVLVIFVWCDLIMTVLIISAFIYSEIL